MSSTIRQLLNKPLPEPIITDMERSLSRKQWTEDFHSIINYTLFPPAAEYLDQMFRPDDLDDEFRLKQPCNPIDCPSEFLETEGDVVRSFHVNVALPIRIAFSSYPMLVHRSEVSPIINPSFSGTVDNSFVTTLGDKPQVAVCGEAKARGVIDANGWIKTALKEEQPGERMKRLGREIRAYAYHYDSPQVFCYDGLTLLIIQFRANERNQIRDKHCLIDCMVVEYDSEGDNCTLREALYQLCAQGVRRCIARLSKPLVIQGYPRVYEYFSGRPLWTVQGGYVDKHPLGYEREFDVLSHAWKWTKEGVFVEWDTVSIQQ